MFIHIAPKFGPLYDALEYPLPVEISGIGSRSSGAAQIRTVAEVAETQRIFFDDAYDNLPTSRIGGLCLIVEGDHGERKLRGKSNKISNKYISALEVYLKQVLGSDRVHTIRAMSSEALCLVLRSNEVSSLVLTGHSGQEVFNTSDRTTFGWWTPFMIDDYTLRSGFVAKLGCGGGVRDTGEEGLPLAHYMVTDRHRALGFLRDVDVCDIESPEFLFGGVDLEYMHNVQKVEAPASNSFPPN